MDENAMINDLIAQLDTGVANGTGHINVNVKEGVAEKEVQTQGSPDCSVNKFACSIPTLDDGSDDLPID